MAARRIPWLERALALGVALGLLTGGYALFGSDGEDEPAAGVTPTPPTTSTLPVPSFTSTTAPPRLDPGAAQRGATVSLVAQATSSPVEVFRRPEDRQPWQRLEHPQPSGAALVFLVREQRGDWLQVLLPVRPNGSTGWVRAEQVRVRRNAYRVEIRLRAHRITVYRGAERILEEPVGVGRAKTPTPGGLYYLKELLEPSNPNGAYGPYAYGLSGFSNVIKEFDGGDGVVGIHGTNRPELIGKDVSHGCIRMSNAGITRLAKILPLGTPVRIFA